MKVAGVLEADAQALSASRLPAGHGVSRENLRLLDRQDPDTDNPADWERACAEQARRGDDAAFARLVDAYTRRIYAHVWRFVRSREDADDLTQETFLRAYRALARFDPQRPFGAWLYTIATNVSLNALRTRSRRLLPVSLESDAHMRPGWHEPRSTVPDGCEKAQRAEEQSRVDAAVDQLDPKAAALVRLHYQEGLALREVGEILGLSESATKVALHRARKRLRIMLIGDEVS